MDGSKSFLIPVPSCPSPARGVCRREAGLWKGEDSKPVISVNFVPWLPGSANFEIRQALQ